MKCEELQTAVANLESCTEEFDAIEAQVEALKSAAALRKSNRAKLIKRSQEQITKHERKINRQLSQYYKAASHHSTLPNTNVGEVPEEVLDGIDEVVRKYFYEMGYASVAREMQKDNHQMARDWTSRYYLYEEIIESMLYKITDGDVGGSTASDVGSPWGFPNIVGPLEPAHLADHTEKTVAVLEAHAASYYHELPERAYKSELSTVLDQFLDDVKRDAKAKAAESDLFSESWIDSKRYTYGFYTAMQHGVDEALGYLNSIAHKPGIDQDLITEFAGKLVTLNPSLLEQEKHDFVLRLRAELVAAVRGGTTIGGTTTASEVPSTDLNAFLNAGRILLDKSLMPILISEFKGRAELPEDVDLPRNLRFHPIVVCPVTKEQITGDDMRILACGHILSKEAVDELMDTAGPGAMKCPYCESVSEWEEITKGQLLDIEHEYRLKIRPT